MTGSVTAIDPGLFASQEAADLAGISVRQLDHWARAGVLIPSETPNRGSGRHRRWNLDEIKVLRLLGHLSAVNAPLVVLKAVARALAGLTISSTDRRWVVADANGNATVVKPSQLAAHAGSGAVWSVALATGIPA